MSADPAAPYERLLELITRELELAGEGQLQALGACQAARAAIIASLPQSPPRQARFALERCELMTRRLRIELLRARESVLLELAGVRTAQRAAHGYAPARGHVRRIVTDA
jgi:hypothetical protein